MQRQSITTSVGLGFEEFIDPNAGAQKTQKEIDNRTVLIIDDDSDFLHNAEENMRTYMVGIKILTATSSRKAIQMLEENKVGLVVTNLNIPGMNVFEVLGNISKNHTETSVIVMIDCSNMDTELKLLQSGYFNILMRPFGLNVLAEKMVEVFKESRDNIGKGFLLSSLIQYTEMEKKTCVLKVKSKSNTGCLYYKNGNLINAEAGELDGESAARLIISWKTPTTTIEAFSNKEIRITTPLKNLAFEAVKAETGSDELDIQFGLLEKAVTLAKGHHYQRAVESLTYLLKNDPRNFEAWFWFSRISTSMKVVETSLNNAAKIVPEDLELRKETIKFQSAKKRMLNGPLQRCPFCWGVLANNAVECMYCDSHLQIHDNAFNSIYFGDKNILKEAVARYSEVLKGENNIKAAYYLGMAHINMENWEEGLGYLDTAVKLDPADTFYADQLKQLLKYIASTPGESTLAVMKSEQFIKAGQIDSQKTSRKKILVVEDSSTTRKVISICLGQQGFEIIEAGDGLEALSQINEVKPDLILLDIILPKVDGYKILSIIKENPDFRDIPVVMLTSKDGILNKVKSKVAGSTAYLTKPFDPKQLLSTVEKYI